MKAIQVMFDESLVSRLDATVEVREKGRSALLRRLAEEYLEQQRRQEIADRYAAAYAGGAALGTELRGWEEEGTWPGEPSGE